MLDINDADQVRTIIETIKKHIVPKEEYNQDNTEGIDVVQADRHGVDRLAECIFEFYLKRTKYHIRLVQKFAVAIADAHPDAWWSHPLLEQALKHDSDKINDLEFAADYAPYLVKKYGPEELTCNFELTPEYKNVWEKDLVVRHCKNNKHHPEGWDKTYDFGENNPPYTPKMMDEVSLAEMCVDWLAVGYEIGNKAIDWFNKTNKTRWIWSNSQKTFILNILDNEDKYCSTIDNPPEHPNLFSDEASKIKTISFPKEEIPTVSKQDRIITTRVSADFNRLQLNDLVKTSWGKIYKITKRIVIDNIEKHPYYRELTEGQISFLSKYDKIAVLELRISDASTEAVIAPTHTTVVISPDYVVDVPRGQMIETKDGQKLFCKPDTGEIEYVGGSTEGLEISTEASAIRYVWAISDRKGLDKVKSFEFGGTIFPTYEAAVKAYTNKKVIHYVKQEAMGIPWNFAKAHILKVGKEVCIGQKIVHQKDGGWWIKGVDIPVNILLWKPLPDVKFAKESLEVSMEALPSGFKEKRKKIEAYILSSMKLLDPHTDINQKYWKNKFASMNDQDFDKFMNYIKEKKCNIHMFVPPLKVHLKNAELVEAAHKLGVKLMHRIWMTDENTGLKYLTPEEYMVLQLPVRRQQQFLDEKLSVPDNDKSIDGLTGQVAGDSEACAITNPEIHILQARNLDNSLYEFANVRGGNIHNYAEFKRSLEETGSVSLKSLDPNSRTRVAVMGGVLLSSMMIDNNFNDM